VASSFSLKSLLPGKSVPIGRAGDFLLYDPASRRVFVTDQDAPVATVIDATHDLVVTTLQLGGIAEQAASDGSGHLFINLADNREVIRVDSQALKVESRWSVPNCESPHGSAIDSASQRLFVSCLNEKLLVLDSVNGRTIATLPIGKGTDGAAYDLKRKRLFSSNGGDGTLSVIAQLGSDQYALIRNVPTARFGRTMALDPDTGRIYIPVADLERIDPHPTTKYGAFVFKPGSFRLMMFDPEP
jgi:DNA-binding beta-propeller fold protein YncE